MSGGGGGVGHKVHISGTSCYLKQGNDMCSGDATVLHTH